MTVPSFVDTNVLIYAEDVDFSPKRDRAEALVTQLLRDGNGWVSVQVLQEFFAVATRKLLIDADTVRRRVELYSHMNVVTFDADDVLAAIDLYERYNIAVWDALILHAALLAGCRRLYSEDFQPGFRVENLEIINPFAA